MNKKISDALTEAGLQQYSSDVAKLGYEKASDFQFPGKVTQTQKDAFQKFAGDDLLPLVRAIEKATGRYWTIMVLVIMIGVPVLLGVLVKTGVI